ncbi:Serine/threonine-protein kinase Nek8 like protein [Argiope bruennichi]|uniref:Serine/threonine-protein kinase Nek8 like protein n=1 Tax=Argiope bruennichi TaxID=94029 RepID=A0A8T0FBN4_ARGBR|nr:Serine/threonine-protein kinase Nek8 like protein [Argiope bruennichi]
MTSEINELETNLRLILLSSACPNIQFLLKSIQKNVKRVIYTFESSSLDDILSFVIAELGGRKVQSIAFVLHGNGKEIYLAGVGNMISVLSLLNHENIVSYYDSFEEDGILMIEMEYADGGSSAELSCSPMEILLPNDVHVVKSFCGYDGTIFLTERGTLLACGQNDYNKLGMNEQKGFLLQMKQFIAKMVQCGDTFTIAGTSENAVYFWGSRQVLSQQPSEQSLTNGNSLKPSKSKNNTRRLSDSEYLSEVSDTSVSEIIKIVFACGHLFLPFPSVVKIDGTADDRNFNNTNGDNYAKSEHIVESNRNQVKKLFLEEDYEERPVSKKSFWSRRGSQASKSKQRSRICSIQ